MGELSITYTVIGEVTGTGALEYGNVSIPLDEALSAWSRPLEDVFPTETGDGARNPWISRPTATDKVVHLQE